ncbi:hypothetical protein PInf_004865 [Phytophthora infestans]|nr:hypothetical protein PInf_004865 [Phytophthora infestans]
MDKVELLTQLALAAEMTLPDFVWLVRGQTDADPRPNKSLFQLDQPPNSSLISAMRIKDELSLHDPLLAELLYDEQKTMIATLKAQLEVKPTSNAQLLRQSRNASSETRGIPKDVVRLMPKQGALNLCMKYLSKEGCSGSSDRTSGKCFSTKRAHFRPKTLPEPVKQHIIKNFGGLAPEFADL